MDVQTKNATLANPLLAPNLGWAPKPPPHTPFLLAQHPRPHPAIPPCDRTEIVWRSPPARHALHRHAALGEISSGDRMTRGHGLGLGPVPFGEPPLLWHAVCSCVPLPLPLSSSGSSDGSLAHTDVAGQQAYAARPPHRRESMWLATEVVS